MESMSPPVLPIRSFAPSQPRRAPCPWPLTNKPPSPRNIRREVERQDLLRSKSNTTRSGHNELGSRHEAFLRGSAHPSILQANSVFTPSLSPHALRSQHSLLIRHRFSLFNRGALLLDRSHNLHLIDF